MYDTLLLPTDGTAATTTVIDHARDIAARRDADVHVLYVVDDRPFLVLGDDRASDVATDLRAEGERAVAAAAAAFDDPAIQVTTEIRTGTPETEIVAAVTDHDADLVVMGTHGDDPTRNLLGSTSQKVVTLSPAPVLTVGVSADDDASEPNPTPTHTD